MKQSFDKDRALARRFQKIEVLEPSEDETLEILKGLRGALRVSTTASTTPTRRSRPRCTLSAKHLKDLHLPDKAIDVLDEAGAAHKLLPAERAPSVEITPTRSSGSSRRWRACRCSRCRATTQPRWPTSSPS